MRSSGPDYGDENKEEFQKKRTESISVGQLIRKMRNIGSIAVACMTSILEGTYLYRSDGLAWRLAIQDTLGGGRMGKITS